MALQISLQRPSAVDGVVALTCDVFLRCFCQFQFEVSLAKAADPAVREELKALFQDHKGESDVHLVVQTSNGPKKLIFGDEFKVQPSPNLRYEIGQLLGADALAA